MESLLDALKNLDQTLFRLINSEWSNSFFDWFFPLITDLHKQDLFVAFFLVVTISASYYFHRWSGLAIYFSGLCAVGASDFLGGKIIKPFFERMRPNLSLQDVVMRAEHFSGYSFTSNHAANIFCAAVFFGCFYPRYRILFLVYASFVAYSRVYVGVHFPADVVIGGAWGAGLGWLGAKLLRQKVDLKNG